MAGELVSRRNLDFLLWEWLGLSQLLERPRFAAHSGSDFAAILDVAEQIAARELAPHARAGDTQEPAQTKDGGVAVLPQSITAVRAMADAGFFATVFDEERGGLQLPQTLHMAAMGLLMAGNIGMASYLLLTAGNARLIAAFGSSAQADAFADPQITGEAMGTMCLSEPHAGSSLADIRTRAEPDGEDALGSRFRIFGGKMWISGGDQDITENIVHLVLAKSPGPDGAPLAGTRGISLFIVPKALPDGTRNDVSVAGLNHKMGQRVLPNCALNFGEGRFTPEGRPGAVGWLVGQVGQGLPQMFQMMNDARVAVGLSGAVLASRGYQLSLAYAQERVQGRGANGAPAVIIEHADVKRMLLAQKTISEGALALVFYCARLLDDEATGPTPEAREAAGALLGLLTPITKSWPSEWGQEALHLALQIFGGAGYTRDFEIEMIYRDNRLNPIHEGTTGIQGIDLVGRKLRRDGGAAFAELRRRIHGSLERARGDAELAEGADVVAGALAALEASVDRLVTEEDQAKALSNTNAFLNAFGHTVVGWLWLDKAIVCRLAIQGGADPARASFYAGKIRAFRYFAEAELPRVAVWLSQVDAMSDLAAAMPADQF